MSIFRIIRSNLYPTKLFKKYRTVSLLPERLFSKNEPEDDYEKPISFSQSPARAWKASFSRSGVKDERLWYEPYVTLLSLSIFMIYFFILREENDVDIELGKSLYSRIEGLEELQLRQLLKYNEENGLPTEEIVARLKEIHEQE